MADKGVRSFFLTPLAGACSRAALPVLVFSVSVFPAKFVQADEATLLERINEYRQNPGQCEGADAPAAGALAPNERLASLQVGDGSQLQEKLDETGYLASAVQVVLVTGPADVDTAMEALRSEYCEALLDPQFSEIGVSQYNQTWQLVLGRPLLDPDLGDWQQAGRSVLDKVNRAREEARRCGDEFFEAASPLSWNDRLAEAAHAHSQEMAEYDYFRHEGQDGSQVDERATRAGYRWQQIGENLASGQGSPEDVISGWLQSPEHCANLMNPDFTEMGAAYVVNPDAEARIYWTKVLGTPVSPNTDNSVPAGVHNAAIEGSMPVSAWLPSVNRASGRMPGGSVSVALDRWTACRVSEIITDHCVREAWVRPVHDRHDRHE